MSAVTFDHGPSFGPGVRATAARVRARRSAGSSTGSLHLTTRGRRLVMVLAILLALAVGLIGGRAMASGPETGIAVDVYTVGSGESLWSIASTQTAPGADVRDIVSDLMKLNELSDSSLVTGQQILLPVSVD